MKRNIERKTFLIHENIFLKKLKCDIKQNLSGYKPERDT